MLPVNHEAHEVAAEDLEAANNFINNYSAREKAYEELLGPNPDMRHMNRLEAIWATTLFSFKPVKDYLRANGLFNSEAEIESKASSFCRIREGKQ